MQWLRSSWRAIYKRLFIRTRLYQTVETDGSFIQHITSYNKITKKFKNTSFKIPKTNTNGGKS